MDRHLQCARHLIGARDQLAKMAALPEQLLRVRLLEKAGADFRRWNLGGDGQHRHARAVAVEQAVDEMEIARPAAAGADRELTREMGLSTGRKGCDFLVPDMNPFDLALTAQRVGQPVETVTDDAVNAFDSCGGENLGELVCDPLCHRSFPSSRAQRKVRAPPAGIGSMFKRFPGATRLRCRRGRAGTARRHRSEIRHRTGSSLSAWEASGWPSVRS